MVKEDGTFRKRLPVAQFCNLMKNKILKNFSISRNPKIEVDGELVDRQNCVHFSLEPTLKLKDWTDAFQLSTVSQDIVKFDGAYFMPSSVETIHYTNRIAKTMSKKSLLKTEGLFLEETKF